jgi:hypothetical protein
VARTDIIDVLGENGSWACTTSGSKTSIVRRILRHDAREKQIGAILPP